MHHHISEPAEFPAIPRKRPFRDIVEMFEYVPLHVRPDDRLGPFRIRHERSPRDRHHHPY